VLQDLNVIKSASRAIIGVQTLVTPCKETFWDLYVGKEESRHQLLIVVRSFSSFLYASRCRQNVIALTF